MDEKLLRQLSLITEEEQEILDGRLGIDKSRYSAECDMVVDSKMMLEEGKFISIRPHTRFVYFPKHKHNYIEIIYMCAGETTHRLDEKEIVLKQGELLFLSQEVTQEIMPAGEHDIAVNFIVLPEYFNVAFHMMGEEGNVLRDFINGNRFQDTDLDRYLHFEVADVLPVQNLIENLIWTIWNRQTDWRSENRFTLGLLLLQLSRCTEKTHSSSRSFDQKLIFQVLRYIDENYKDGELTELAGILNYDVYWLSRMIKKLTGRNYKGLLQAKRLKQAAFLLNNTQMNVFDVSIAVGYDNTSYFHRIFKEFYGVSPKEFRNGNESNS